MLDNDTLINIFIKDVPLALAIFDREMRYIYASARWRNDYGLGDRPLKGISHYDLFPEIPKAWREAHRQCLSGKYLRADTDRIEHLGLR